MSDWFTLMVINMSETFAWLIYCFLSTFWNSVYLLFQGYFSYVLSHIYILIRLFFLKSRICKSISKLEFFGPTGVSISGRFYEAVLRSLGDSKYISFIPSENFIFPNYFHKFFSAWAVEKKIVKKPVLDEWKVCFIFQLLKLRKKLWKKLG